MVPPIFVASGDLIWPLTGASGAAYWVSTAGSRVVLAATVGRPALRKRLPLCYRAAAARPGLRLLRWWAMQDLNLRPQRCQRCALTN